LTTPRKPNKLKPPEGWKPPSWPPPRQRYVTTEEPVRLPSAHGGRDTCLVTVNRLADEPIGQIYAGAYTRLAPGLGETFEPFRQGRRDYALIATDKYHMGVLDLETGDIVAEERPSRSSTGPAFCPLEFFVPDWWDVHGPNLDGPGEPVEWEPEYNWPIGHFGLVYGQFWAGHDFSLQCVDLSEVKQGYISRDDRFGKLPLRLNGPLHKVIHFSGETRAFDAPMEVQCRLSGEVSAPFRELHIAGECLPRPPAPAVYPVTPAPAKPARWIASRARRRNKRR
jgi:hypothetical protein